MSEVKVSPSRSDSKQRTTLMPTGNEMMSILHTVNVFYKAELALSQFVTMMLWTSFSEVLLWWGLFATFCAQAMHTGIIWL